jgi:hypothetical protein
VSLGQVQAVEIEQDSVTFIKREVAESLVLGVEIRLKRLQEVFNLSPRPNYAAS